VVVTTPRGLTVVDGRRRRVLARIGGFGDALGVCLDFTGRWAYVADAARRELVAVDLARRRIAWRVDVGAQPEDVVLVESTIAVVAGDRVVLVDAATRDRRWLDPGRRIRAATFAPDGVWVFVGGKEASVAKLGLIDGRVVRRIRLHAPATALAVDATGHALWAAEGRRAEVLSPTGRLLGSVVARAPIRQLAPVGGWMALVTRGGIDMVASPSLAPRQRFPVAGAVRSVAFVVT